MNLLEQFDIHNLHHTYMVVGDREILEKTLLEFVEQELEFSVNGNPDFSHTTFETFGIDDARNLTELHIRKPFSGERKISIISVFGMTVEAQNALLKLFEEPIAGNHFFLIIPEDNVIIPTLRSRMQVIYGDREIQNNNHGAQFLSLTIADRLKGIAEIVESKDKERAKKLIRSITKEVHTKGLIEHSEILKDLLKAEEYLSDRAPSIKMLLEHIAYRIPVMK